MSKAVQVEEEEYESPLLEARGRTMVMYTEGRPHKSGNLVQARFKSYDIRKREVTLRLDDNQVPEFWAEVKFDMDTLLRFIQEEELRKEGITEDINFF